MSSAVLKSSIMKTKASPFKVMVVDDSAIIRGFLCRYLSEDTSMEVVATAHNGIVALQQLEQHDIEVVVLDIEMPRMDGITALPKMMEIQPNLQIIMASTLTRRNAQMSLRALQLGAVDYVAKPETNRSVNTAGDFRQELVGKVKAWATLRRSKLGQNQPFAGDGEKRIATNQQLTSSAERILPKKVFSPAFATMPLRGGSEEKPHILLIGSSTGGPQALLNFFTGFDNAPPVPVLITQHMPATFTAILADHLQKATGWPTHEGADSMEIKAGHIYVAPGGRHMELARKSGLPVLKITDDPPENFCRPAVDPMLRSASKVFGKRSLGVMLTGMGHDGLNGARALIESGATLLAQDRASSVVWGMPGAVAEAGLCTEILPITELGAAAERWLHGGAA